MLKYNNHYTGQVKQIIFGIRFFLALFLLNMYLPSSSMVLISLLYCVDNLDTHISQCIIESLMNWSCQHHNIFWISIMIQVRNDSCYILRGVKFVLERVVILWINTKILIVILCKFYHVHLPVNSSFPLHQISLKWELWEKFILVVLKKQQSSKLSSWSYFF